MRKVLRKDLAGFYATYLLKDSFKPMSQFHAKMFSVLQDPELPLVEIMGFRGSAKSTIGSLALPLWAALEHPELYQFIVIVADSAQQAALNIAAIKYELENNELLRLDYGDQRSDEENWQARNMVLKNGVRIIARSRGQKVRGIRHREHRPKLIVVDDPEDLEWIKTVENRIKTERWFNGEVIPSTDATQSKIVLIGNMLHNDALMARMRRNPLFAVFDFPLVDEYGVCLWPAMYPTQESLDRQRQKVGDTSWYREYMLKVVPEEGQDVLPEDIHYYDELPFDDGNIIGRGGDLAISTLQTADCTACVSGEATWPNGELKIYVYPNPLNRRMNFATTMDAFTDIQHSTKMWQRWFVEDVMYQRAAVEELERRGFDVVRMHPVHDKRSRLRVAARYIKNGTVMFPRTGCEALLTQLFGFGIEKHDDMVDALVYMIIGLVQEGISSQTVQYV